MVVLRITADSNPCTVYFDKPILKANHVSLLSCTLPNSWYNLKEDGKIFFFNKANTWYNATGFKKGITTLKQ